VRSREILTSLGAEVLGVVVNGAGRKNDPGGEDYGYGYEYGYRYRAGDGYYQESDLDAPDIPEQAPPLLAPDFGVGSNPEIDLGGELPQGDPACVDTALANGDTPVVTRRKSVAAVGTRGNSARPTRRRWLRWMRRFWQ
jgi:hypothetical protein